MSGFTMGLPARILALGAQLDDSVMPAIREVPWKVTALPAARQLAISEVTYASPSNFAARWGSVAALASDTTLQTLVSVTGSGFLEFAAVWGGNTAGTVRLVISIDGTDLLDSTGASASQLRILCGCGAWSVYPAALYMPQFEAWRVPFRTSLVLKAQQSATTIAASLLYRYTLAQPYTA